MTKIERCSDAAVLCRLYGEFCAEKGAITLPLDTETFRRVFFQENCIHLAAWQGNRPIGFASGCADAGRRVGYLSFIGVCTDMRRQGIGRALLHALEQELCTFPFVRRIETVFFNPVHLPWRILVAGGATHPCMPGTDQKSALYPLLLSDGYTEWTVQNAYYRALAGYTDPPTLAKTRARLLSEGIEVTLYDPAEHRDLAGLFDDINNPGWGAQVLAAVDQPIVVAVDHTAENLIVSYTGPLSTDPGGRGNFCGIGTRRAYRGRGIGKVVFCEMCRRHAERGATFMSLYTGDQNPARHIYEAAGFCIVRSFGNLRKEVVLL